MKKIIAVLSALAMVFAFASCGGGGSSEEPAADDQQETSTEAVSWSAICAAVRAAFLIRGIVVISE